MLIENRLWDVLVIGSGMGGSAFASKFVNSGLDVLVLERGNFLKPEKENWDPHQVIGQGRYESPVNWLTTDGRQFHPRVYYHVGGSSKFFGGTAFRFRKSDFKARTIDGVDIPAWPIDYDELEPFYTAAEKAMKVHGISAADPTEALRSDYPYPPIQNEPLIDKIAQKLKTTGLNPFPLPIAVDQAPQGRCRKGSPCDGFPCRIRAKGDAENAFLRPALKADQNIHIQTNTQVIELIHDASGQKIIQAIGLDDTERKLIIKARVFVLAAGASETARLLLRSKSPTYPDGLANNNGMVGRNFMSHNNSVLMAIHPFRYNRTMFQKTLAINDFYHSGHPDCPKARGNIQTRGKIHPANLQKHPSILIRMFRHSLASRSVDFWLMSEDAPLLENRIYLDADGRIVFHRRESCMESHNALVRHFQRKLIGIGFPIVIIQKPRLTAVQHQCGTLRFGSDPDSSVLNPDGRSHQIENMYVCDASIFPSSAAVNPALTIAANALRIGDIVRSRITDIKSGQQ